MEKNNKTVPLFIKYPGITEKTTKLNSKNIYTFIVDKKLSKNKLKNNFEILFDIKIESINTLNLPLKYRRVGKFIGKTSNYKKVYIKLKNGYQINNIF